MLIKNLKVILLFGAGLIILLHTLVPHQHESDLYINEKEEILDSNSVIDIIKIAFLNDLGIGHLDNFESSQSDLSFDDVNTSPDYSFQSVSEFEIQISYRIEIKNDICKDVIIPNQSLLQEKIKLRGPPALKLA